MKNIYILNEFQSSKRNGLGLFIKELLQSLKAEEYLNLNLININSDHEEFTYERTDKINIISIPIIREVVINKISDILMLLFRLHIEDSSSNIFILNHSPCNKLVERLKEIFPLSKIIFVIHDFGWTKQLLGNSKQLKQIVSSTDESVKIRYKGLLEYIENEKYVYNAIDRVVTLSDDSHWVLQDIYEIDRNKINVIANGLSDSYEHIGERKRKALKKKLNISEHEKIIIFTGRIDKAKGGDSLIKSFTKVLKTNPNSRLVVLGTLCNTNEVFNKVAKISSKITFTGHINRDQVAKWYQIADIGIISSYYEQCSYSAMEMLMYGIPVVASDGFGVRCMFLDKVNSIVAPILNHDNDTRFVNNLSKAILNLLDSEKLRVKLGKEGRHIYKSRYEVKVMKYNYLQLINTL